VKFIFKRRAIVPSTKKSRAVWIAVAFITSVSSITAIRADEVLDRGVRFHIAASPLANALIEFSTQSGIQVAAADADVAQLRSNGVQGDYSIDDALSILLQGTHLQFSHIGAATIAIRNAPDVHVASSAVRSGVTEIAAKPLASETPQPHPENATSPTDIPDVTVLAPRLPTDQELAGDSLEQFVLHHATTHFLSTSTTGNLARWRGGKQSICPSTEGLTPGFNAFVTARIRALADYAGAPVQSDPQCKVNVQVLFTNKPREEMDAVIKWATVYFRNRYAGRMQDLIAYRSDHAIQGWYMATNGGAVVLNTDMGFVGFSVLPIWPQITQNHIGIGKTGTRVGGGSGTGIGIGIVILVVDATKVVGYPVGALADYAAMLTLSVVQSPDHCDPLPSILDLMSSSCATREIPTGITAGDLAFLKALYYKNTGLGASLSRPQIEENMTRQFKPQ
jgi:Secretin and TonB N terminus short domain